MTIEVRRKGKVDIVDFSGTLTIGNSAGIRERFKSLVHDGGMFIFNMQNVTYMDSAGLGETAASLGLGFGGSAAAGDEEGEQEAALHHYRAALASDPLYPDLHINLALLYEKRGMGSLASHHWRRYLKLDAEGTWSKVARQRLESDD